MNPQIRQMRIGEIFRVKSGDFHSLDQLDSGDIPLVACGETNNGVVGYYDIPRDKIYHRAITVAYNGRPLTTKFHPYKFGTKDDVAILIPRNPMLDATLFYVASLLNLSTWRYSYGRKCYRQKLEHYAIPFPVVETDGAEHIDEKYISKLMPSPFEKCLPLKDKREIPNQSPLNWQSFNISEIFDLARGDFHSITALDPGTFMTVSRVTDDNGVVGYFSRPKKAKIYSRGVVTISTVGSDAFVQLDDFIATDNVIICKPKRNWKISTLFFMAFMINQQKWRYSYGRQCYLEKLSKIKFPLPVTAKGEFDENYMRQVVEGTPYWSYIKQRF